jgi:hypothetical protein
MGMSHTIATCEMCKSPIAQGAFHLCGTTDSSESRASVTRAEFDALRRDVSILLAQFGMVPTLPAMTEDAE